MMKPQGRWLGYILLLACLGLAACADGRKPAGQVGGQAAYKVGKPYQVAGIWYYPAIDYDYAETGIASWYGPGFHGRATANGEAYDMNALTAAHRTLPMPSMVRITNLENGRQLALRVNDRGPFVNNRIIDVSRRGAQLLGFEQRGTARVRVEIMEAESRQLAMLAGAGAAAATQTAAVAPSAVAVTSPQVTAAPAGAVTTETLAPPGQPAGSASAATVARRAPEPIVGKAAAAPGPQADGRVTMVPVRKTAMFIQAGAFTNVANANRLRTRLAALGRAQVVPATVGNQQFYRVRVGPIASLDDADSLLARVVAAGHPEARIIVD
ncbi:MAG: septal ring lytic transglycosylase RlpA family protein [Dongiaceae bacterium]